MSRPTLTALVTDEMFPLPVAWDGRRVEWSREKPIEGTFFICPPPKDPERCSKCRSAAGVITYRGLVIPNPGDTVEGEALRARWRNGRIEPVREQLPAHAVVGLIAWRCRDCMHDVVWELETGQQWDLGPEDYGPEGSVPPETP